MKKNLIWKCLAGAMTGTVGIIAPVTVSCSCGGQDEPVIPETYISIPDYLKTKSTKTNSVDFIFSVNNDGPSAINTVDIVDGSPFIELTKSSNILVDPVNHIFTITVNIKKDVAEWTAVNFNLAFSYVVKGQSNTEQINDFYINNDIKHCDWISCEHRIMSSEKIGWHTEYKFKFDTTEHAAPTKISNASIRSMSLDPGFITLNTTSDIDVNDDGSFSISVHLHKDPQTLLYFSLTFNFFIDDTEYISYSDELGIFYDPGYDIEREYLTFYFPIAGECWLECSDPNVPKYSKNLFYSINDDANWTQVGVGDHIHAGTADTVRLAGWNDEWSTESCFYSFKFSSSNVTIGGSVESIIHDGIPAYWIPSSYCFSHLFADNTSSRIDTSMNILPFHCLKPHCYDSMFMNSLIDKLELSLPAKVLEEGCYYNMFKNSKKLKRWMIYLFYNFTDTDNVKKYFNGWLDYIEDGTYSDVMAIPHSSKNYEDVIPSGWGINRINEQLTLVSNSSSYFNQFMLTMRNNDEDEVLDQTKDIQLKYSLGYTFKDQPEEWKDVDLYKGINLPKGEYIRLIGVNKNGFSKNYSDNHYSFKIPNEFLIFGSLGDLIVGHDAFGTPFSIPELSTFQGLFANSGVQYIDEDFFEYCVAVQPYAFKSMFYKAKSLSHLPAAFKSGGNAWLDGSTGVCESMFQGSGICDSDIAINIKAESSYGYNAFRRMFANCEHLTNVADGFVNGHSVNPNAFEGAFSGCVHLESFGTICTNEVSKESFKNMFYGCSSLKRQPDLRIFESSIPSIAESCFESMFEGCTSMHSFGKFSIKSNLLSENCFKRMYANCPLLQSGEGAESKITIFLPSKTDDMKQNALFEMFKGDTNLHAIHLNCNGWALSDLSKVTSAFKNWIPNDTTGDMFFFGFSDKTPDPASIPADILYSWNVRF